MVLLPASRRTILRALTAAVITFTLLHLGAVLVEYATGDPEYFQRLHLGEIRRQFDLEQETNLTTWYSSATLLFCAFLLRTVGRYRQSERDRFAAHWTVLACAFVYLSIDETAMFHEATIAPLQRVFHASGIFFYAWVIIALPILAAFLIGYFRFLTSLPRHTLIAFVVAGTVYVGGAIGFEMVEGLIEMQGGEGGLVMVLARACEEIMEMLGVLLFIRALLDIVQSLPRTAGNLDAI